MYRLKPVNELNLTMKVAVNRPQNNRDHKQVGLHFLSKFAGSSLNRWRVMAWASSKLGKFGFSSYIWPCRSSIAPQNNRDLNQVVLHLLSKFCGSSLNVWWFMARTSSGLTDTQTDRHRQWQYPEAKTGLGLKSIVKYSLGGGGWGVWGGGGGGGGGGGCARGAYLAHGLHRIVLQRPTGKGTYVIHGICGMLPGCCQRSWMKGVLSNF